MINNYSYLIKMNDHTDHKLYWCIFGDDNKLAGWISEHQIRMAYPKLKIRPMPFKTYEDACNYIINRFIIVRPSVGIFDDEMRIKSDAKQ